MKIAPRVDADHQNIVSVLAFLALDCPMFRDVIRSLVVELYGARGVWVYDTYQRELSLPSPAPVGEKADG